MTVRGLWIEDRSSILHFLFSIFYPPFHSGFCKGAERSLQVFARVSGHYRDAQTRGAGRHRRWANALSEYTALKQALRQAHTFIRIPNHQWHDLTLADGKSVI